MVIIFYDADKEQIYICTEREKMKSISINDPDILTHVPNDDVLYVQNAHFITKKQFGDWLEGNGPSLDSEPHRFTGFLDEDSVPYTETAEAMQEAASQYEHSKFIHPAHNGTILIVDLKTPKYPNGVELTGKYDFLCVDDVGGFDGLEESMHYRSLLAKGKIEVVGYDYVKKHYNKKKTTSMADAALDAILIKSDARGSAEA
ncbi:hypothetical protein LCGC14_3150760, partial [marine sediment metagenome]